MRTKKTSRTKVVKVPATTNNITKAIVNFLLSEGHTASRINTGGTYDEAKQRYIPSGSRNGFSDISAGIRGIYNITDFVGIETWPFKYCQYVAIEIKKGKDEMRDDQVIFLAEVEHAGGIYLEIKTYQQFLDWYSDQTWINKSKA